MGSRDPQRSLYYFKGSGIQRRENSRSKMLFFSLEATEIFLEIKCWVSRWPQWLIAFDNRHIKSHTCIVKLRKLPFIIIKGNEKRRNSKDAENFHFCLLRINKSLRRMDLRRESLDLLIALLCPTFS